MSIEYLFVTDIFVYTCILFTMYYVFYYDITVNYCNICYCIIFIENISVLKSFFDII